MKQRYTSKDTSINSTKMPRIYSIIGTNYDGSVLDYGCGKYFDSYGLPASYVGYDKFNYPNAEALNRHYDVALCSNVLNVIAEADIRAEIISDLARLADTVYITVYEGDSTGIGRATKADCYQLNRKLKEYIPEVSKHFASVRVTRGCLVCNN